MSNKEKLVRQCPFCHTDVTVTITYGVYPYKTMRKMDMNTLQAVPSEPFSVSRVDELEERFAEIERCVLAI